MGQNKHAMSWIGLRSFAEERCCFVVAVFVDGCRRHRNMGGVSQRVEWAQAQRTLSAGHRGHGLALPSMNFATEEESSRA